jgi:N-carbamoylputrescine amidase
VNDVRVAAVQMNAGFGRNAENLDGHEGYITRAAEAGARLVVFPEQSISGHWAEPGFNKAAEAVPGGPSTQRLIQLCRQHGLYAGAGLAELSGGAVYNSYLLVGPDGFVGLQRKVHPSGDEYFYYRAGASFEVFDLPFCRLGVNICADTGYPESARVAALKGAEVLLCPHAARCGPAPENLQAERQRVRQRKDRAGKFGSVRAADNGLFLVDCNQVGVAGQVEVASGFTGTRDVVHAGGTMIFRPDGELLADSKTERFQEEMVLADLAAADLAAARGRKCFNLTTRRPGAYRIIADPQV